MKRRDFLKLTGMGIAGLALPAIRASAQSSTLSAPNVIHSRMGGSVELVQWDWSQSAQGDWLDSEIKLFNAANPNITIKRVIFDPNEGIKNDKLSLAKKDGSLPDIFTSTYIDTFTYPDLAYPLSGFSDFSAFKAAYPTPDLDFAEGKNVWQGKTYAAPTDMRSAWWNQLYVNVGVLKDNGINDLPSTMDEFLDDCRKVTKNSGGKVYGVAFPFPTWEAMMWQFLGARSALIWGLDWRTGKHAYGVNPNYRVVYETLATLRDEGLILPESSSLDDQGIRSLFAQGAAAFTLTGLWAITDWAKNDPDFKEYTLVPPPLIGSTQEYTFFNAPGLTSTGYYIGADTKHSDEAWLWYKWLHSKETMERYVKAGMGFSIFPENNKPEYFTTEAQKAYIKYAPDLNRVAPDVAIRNPDMAKLQVPPVKPDEPGLTTGIFSGQVKKADIPAALDKLAQDKDAAIQQALSDGVKAGLKVKFEDYIFADWDPLKDYLQKK
jgi:multiple sugar transport system substrate-binding protein